MFIGGPDLFLSFVLPIAVLGILALVGGVALRQDRPDRRGRRPFAVYLLTVMLVTLFAAVFSIFRAASAVVRAAMDPVPYHLVTYGSGGLIGVGSSGVPEPPFPPGETPIVPPEWDGPVLEEIPPEAFLESFPSERPTAEVVEALIVAILAGAVFAFHRAPLRGLIGTEAVGE